MQKATVKADIKNNRLYFNIEGRLTKKALDNLYTDVRFCVADLQPGFDVITDLSKCTLSSISGLPTFRKISTYLLTSQVGRIVRIIDDNNLIFKQILNFAEKFQGYQTINVTSFEEADETLNQATRREAIRLNLHHKEIHYTADTVDGKATILDISTNGCAVHNASEAVEKGAELTIKLEFEGKDDQIKTFSIVGSVVRAEQDTFSVQYLNFDENQKKELWNCLVRETEKEISCDQLQEQAYRQNN